MRKNLEKVLTSQPGWPRAVFAGTVIGLGGLAVACLEVSGGPAATALAGVTAVVIAGMAVRAWIGPAPEGEDNPAC